MKGKIVFFLLLVIGISCKSDQDVKPESSAYALRLTDGVQLPFGKFYLEKYEDDEKSPHEIILEVKNEKDRDGHYIIHGQATVNFYFAKFSADFESQEITIYSVGSTRIEGAPSKQIFETEYLQRLATATTYDYNVNGDKFILGLTDNKKMIFTLDKN